MKVLVTGAGRGIGRAVALRLGRDGHDVAVQVNASVETGREVCEDIRAEGGRGELVTADLSDKRQAAAAVAGAAEKLGGLDGLVLNAAISSSHDVFDVEDNEIDYVIDTNLKAPIVLSREAMRLMRAARGGNIVIVGSTAAQTGGALVGPHYATSKAGTHTLVKSLARSGAPCGIRVNGVAPGFVDTDGLDRMVAARGPVDAKRLVPLGRVGSPAEVAACVAFLLSDAASYVDGAMLDVNGGLFMR